VDRVVSNPRFNQIAQQIADHSITLVRDEQRMLPVDPKGRLLNITFTDEEDRAIAKVFVDELRARASRSESLSLDNLATESDVARILARLDESKFDTVSSRSQSALEAAREAWHCRQSANDSPTS